MTSPDDPREVTYDVTYRATVTGGGQAEIRLQTTFVAATLADAWERLTALYDGVDPRTIEIELRECATPHSAQPALTRGERRREPDNFQNSRSTARHGGWIDPSSMCAPVCLGRLGPSVPSQILLPGAKTIATAPPYLVCKNKVSRMWRKDWGRA